MSESKPDLEMQLCRLACTGRLDEAKELLDQHPDLLRNSVHCAAVWGDADATAALLERDASAACATLTCGWSPLMVLSLSHWARPGAARSAGIVRCAQHLLRHSADVNTRIADDELPGKNLTALAAAAGVIGNEKLCEVLLEAGAPPNDGAALFVAVAEQHWDCVELLRARGADLDATDADGRFTPLHWLLDERYARAALERLLKIGADPNTRAGALQETPLHVAVRRRRVEALKPLRTAGADLNARTRGGMTAYRHALRRHFPEVAERLARLGADTTTTPGDAVAVALQDGRMAEARKLLQRDATLVSSNVPEEARLLADLAGAGKLDAVRLLLDCGVDIAARGLDGGTALHQTAWFGQPDVARLLVERGAPLTLRGDDHDCTPLGWVAHGSCFSGGAKKRSALYVELAEILLQAGAPFPQPTEEHDRVQLGQASEPVAAVLRRFGWNPTPHDV